MPVESNNESIAARMADVATAGLPLEAGLRAVAEEMRGRDRSGMLAVCERLEAGQSPDAALGSVTGVSPHLVELVRAGMRTGELGLVLSHYVEQRRDQADRRSRLFAMLVYPTLLVLMAGLVIGFLLCAVVPQFSSIFDGFGVELPWMTRFVVGLADFLVTYLPFAILVLLSPFVILALLSTFREGRILVRQTVHLLPIVGPLVRYGSLASFCDLLGLLVSQRVPLPEALRMAAAATRDPALARSIGWVADDVALGTDAAESAREHALPTGLQQALLWSDDERAFAESLTATGRVYDVRARENANLLNAIVSPFVIACVATTIGIIVYGLFSPLINLLDARS